MKVLGSLTVLAVLLLVHAAPARASSIVVVNPCVSTNPEADAVFMGTVVSITTEDIATVQVLPVRSVVRFSVEEAYKGVSTKEFEVVKTAGMPEGLHFNVGERYLVWADRRDGEFWIHGNSRWVRPDALILRQFRAVKAVPASILGEVTGVIRTAGIPIQVRNSNGKVFTTETQTDGSYEFLNLPPDTYEIQPTLPSRYAPWLWGEQKGSMTLRLEPGTSCDGSFTILRELDGRIAGRIVTPDGKPQPGVVILEYSKPVFSAAHNPQRNSSLMIALERTQPDERRSALLRAVMGGIVDTIHVDQADAHFEFSVLTPGRYRLRFAPEVGGKADLSREVSCSQEIELVEGQHVGDIVFVVSQPVP